MYSVEYTWTRVETVRTTMNIVYVKASTEKFQLISNNPETAQAPSEAICVTPDITSGAIAKRDRRRAPILTIIKKAS